MSLDSILHQWSRSPAGRKKIAAARKQAMAEGRKFGRAVDRAIRTPGYYASRLMSLLDEEIRAAGFEFGDYLYQVDAGYNEEKQRYEVHVSFKPEEIDRPSLYPEKYPVGKDVYDIVALMNHGYHARDHVYGTWHDQRVRSLRDREGAQFIQKAVDRFNDECSGSALAVYDDKY